MDKKPKILALGPQNVFPPTDGGKEGIFGALKSLCDYFDVTYVFPAGEHPVDFSGYADAGIHALPINYTPLESLKSTLWATLQLRPFKFQKYSSRAAVHAYCMALPKESYSLVLCFHAHTWRLGEAIRRCLNLKAPVIVREHNIEYEVVASYMKSLRGAVKLAAGVFLRLTEREEQRMWRQADSVAFLTVRDLAVAKSHSRSGRQFLAPEGIEIPPPRVVVYPGPDAPLLLLFNPNAIQSVLNLQRFVVQHWARVCCDPRMSGTRLRVTGQSQVQLAETLSLEPQELEAMRIDALGFVPDLQVEFKSCLALLSPTFTGGGIRKKILEAMAHQVPVIATSLDIESTNYFLHENNILCFDDQSNALSNSIVALQQNQELWKRLSQNGRKTVESYASWPLFAKSISDEFNILHSRF